MSNRPKTRDLRIQQKALMRALVRTRKHGYADMGQTEEILLGETTRLLKERALEERDKGRGR